MDIEDWKREVQIDGSNARVLANLILDICRVHASSLTNSEILNLISCEKLNDLR